MVWSPTFYKTLLPMDFISKNFLSSLPLSCLGVSTSSDPLCFTCVLKPGHVIGDPGETFTCFSSYHCMPCISILVERRTSLRTNPIIFRATGERDKAWGGRCFPQTVFRGTSWEGRSKRRGPKNNSKAWRWKVQASPGRRSQGPVTSSRQVWSLAQHCFMSIFILAWCHCLQGQKYFPN